MCVCSFNLFAAMIWTPLLGQEKYLTFDLRDKFASRSQSLDGIEERVHVDDLTQDSQHLAQTLVSQRAPVFLFVWNKKQHTHMLLSETSISRPKHKQGHFGEAVKRSFINSYKDSKPRRHIHNFPVGKKNSYFAVHTGRQRIEDIVHCALCRLYCNSL